MLLIDLLSCYETIQEGQNPPSIPQREIITAVSVLSLQGLFGDQLSWTHLFPAFLTFSVSPLKDTFEIEG